jgi:hypothetical protein
MCARMSSDLIVEPLLGAWAWAQCLQSATCLITHTTYSRSKRCQLTLTCTPFSKQRSIDFVSPWGWALQSLTYPPSKRKVEVRLFRGRTFGLATILKRMCVSR